MVKITWPTSLGVRKIQQDWKTYCIVHSVHVYFADVVDVVDEDNDQIQLSQRCQSADPPVEVVQSSKWLRLNIGECLYTLKLTATI